MYVVYVCHTSFFFFFISSFFFLILLGYIIYNIIGCIYEIVETHLQITQRKKNVKNNQTNNEKKSFIHSQHSTYFIDGQNFICTYAIQDPIQMHHKFFALLMITTTTSTTTTIATHGEL